MKIDIIAKRIYDIRKAMGYSTKKQRAEGPEGEIKFIEDMVDGLKKEEIHSSGGFSYKFSPSGKTVIITPDFKFRFLFWANQFIVSKKDTKGGKK